MSNGGDALLCRKEAAEPKAGRRGEGGGYEKEGAPFGEFEFFV